MKWEIKRLGDFVNIKTGKLDANASSSDGVYPFFTCSKEPLKISSYSYDCECVLVAGNGDLNVKYFIGKFDAYQRTYIVETLNLEMLNVRYLYYFLDTYLVTLREQSIGGVIKYIKLENLSDAKIPLPPLPIQKRIAEILDVADALKRKDQELLKKYDELAEGIFIEMFGDPVRNEKGWKKYIFSEILEKIESGWSPVCLDRSAVNDEWGILKLGAITSCIYDDKENKALPPNEKPKENIEVKVGDILFSRKNTYDLVAACALVKSTRPCLMMSDLIFRLQLKSSSIISPIYLHSLLIYPTKRLKIQSLASGAAGSMPNISKEKLMGIEIELPPIELQNKYATHMQQVSMIQEKIKKSIYNSENLFQTLVQKAFNGELVS